MSPGNFLKRLFNRLQPRREPPAQDALLPIVIHMLENTEEVELSCDDVFHLLDQYAEMAQRGEDVSRLKPLVARHLQLCVDCQEELDALLCILESSISG